MKKFQVRICTALLSYSGSDQQKDLLMLVVKCKSVKYTHVYNSRFPGTLLGSVPVDEVCTALTR